jgi:hypothetical protein
VAAENLLTAVCPPDDRVQRQRWLRAIFALTDWERIRVSGKPHRTSVASALIALNSWPAEHSVNLPNGLATSSTPITSNP